MEYEELERLVALHENRIAVLERTVEQLVASLTGAAGMVMAVRDATSGSDPGAPLAVPESGLDRWPQRRSA